MKSYKLRIAFISIVLLVLSGTLCSAYYDFYFKLDVEGSQTYRFGFSKDAMTNENMIPAPLSGTYDFGTTEIDGNGNVYASTSDIYVYWRMVSSEGAVLRISATPLQLVGSTEGTSDTKEIEWTVKQLNTYGDGAVSIDSAFTSEGGWLVSSASSLSKKVLHENKQSTTCWGCVQFECTTVPGDYLPGEYSADITLTLEAQ